ncbi:hypothetical protein FDB55_07410 [Clostridium botulinum]|uniref:ECF transporter S component n=1 Tax=Clostridium botulinum TaxID=1491 RepID=A0A0M1LHT6_CLOBO|nr:hypothetical protein [Clostridium botulinum]KAI3349395.1 hypothetical protein CIT18_09010 [Clostridium botulinum]KOM87304.1 hypothetical protein ACP51_13985 [Clostridium botulinum]KOR57211.1 hypothetical protein ADT22_13355 [Clostridium botulinum]MBN1043227.1 hypothetical protein [Clostridium botulinum]MBN1072232.1 hypothetical protein [Clostridium botulinum]
MKISIRELILFGILGAILTIAKISLDFIPNVEAVSLLVIIYSLIYGKKSIFIIFIFVIMMGLIYGFGPWWIGYFILWPALNILTSLLSKFIKNRYLVLSLYSGMFGLLFGLFYAIPYAIFGGINAGIVYWTAGIPYDIVHGLANYFIMLFLGEKIYELLFNLNKNYFNLESY